MIDRKNREGQIVTPSQTTVLKLVDAFIIQLLKSQQSDHDAQTLLDHLMTPLLLQYVKFVAYARTSLKNSLGSVKVHSDGDLATDEQTSIDPSRSSMPDDKTRSAGGEPSVEEPDPLRQVDVILPRVCEALVLITQIFCNMLLEQDSKLQLSENANRRKESLTQSVVADEERLIEKIIGLLPHAFPDIDAATECRLS